MSVCCPNTKHTKVSICEGSFRLCERSRSLCVSQPITWIVKFTNCGFNWQTKNFSFKVILTVISPTREGKLKSKNLCCLYEQGWTTEMHHHRIKELEDMLTKHWYRYNIKWNFYYCSITIKHAPTCGTIQLYTTHTSACFCQSSWDSVTSYSIFNNTRLYQVMWQCDFNRAEDRKVKSSRSNIPMYKPDCPHWSCHRLRPSCSGCWAPPAGGEWAAGTHQRPEGGLQVPPPTSP